MAATVRGSHCASLTAALRLHAFTARCACPCGGVRTWAGLLFPFTLAVLSFNVCGVLAPPTRLWPDDGAGLSSFRRSRRAPPPRVLAVGPRRSGGQGAREGYGHLAGVLPCLGRRANHASVGAAPSAFLATGAPPTAWTVNCASSGRASIPGASNVTPPRTALSDCCRSSAGPGTTQISLWPTFKLLRVEKAISSHPAAILPWVTHAGTASAG